MFKGKKDTKKKGSSSVYPSEHTENKQDTPGTPKQKLEIKEPDTVSKPPPESDKNLSRKENLINVTQWLTTRAVLSFRVVEGKDLIQIEDGFKDETLPFVRVTLPTDDTEDEVDFYETKTWKFKTSPLWNQEFKFETFGNGPVNFLIEVLDKDELLVRENQMGSCNITYTKDFDGWVPLEGVKSGQIRVVIKKIE